MSLESPSPGASPTPEPGGSSRKGRLFEGGAPRIVASLLIAGGFVWLLSRGGLPLLPPKESLAKVPAWAIAAFLAGQVLACLLRTYRWVFLLRPIAPGVRVARVMGIGFVGFSAIFLAPLRMGEIVRPYLMAQDGEVTFLQAGGTVFAERVIDGLVLTLFTITSLSLATTVSPLPRSLGDLPLPLAAVPAAVYSATLAFCGLFVAMTVFYAARAPALRFTRWLFGLFSERAAAWAAGTVERLADGLSFLPSRRHLAAFLGTTLTYWAVVILSQWTLMRGAGLAATPVQAATMVGVVGLGSVVPAGPGLFGAFQIASFSALALFFPLTEVRAAGAALIFVAYVVQVLVSSLQCVAGFALLARARPPQLSESASPER
jgi:uncharacterized membrane protein YbhN (UPF0104 family)